MHDEAQSPSMPPQPPESPAAPPIAPPPVASYPPAAEAAPPRKKRWWIWLLVIGGLFLCMIASCLPFAALLSLDSGSQGFTGFGDAVAVIRLDGPIQGTGSAGTVTPDNFLAALKRAEDDSRVKAIVLRVDSPGGTVAASEEIASYVRDAEKPVVVSVGDICASGAYMVSSQADRIYAIEGSSVGSIGVIQEIPNVKGLLDKLGISMNTITAGKNKDTGSPYRALTKDERARLQGQVDEVYEQFIRIVAEGRDIPAPEVRKLATGWAWTGTEAKKLGLIDEIGTYKEAVDGAAKLGGIEGEPEIITYEDPFSGLLSGLEGVAGRLAPYGTIDPQPGSALPR